MGEPVSARSGNRADQLVGAPVSLLLHVLPGPASAGLIVGRIETVATGETTPLRAQDDLAEVILRLTLDRAPS